MRYLILISFLFLIVSCNIFKDTKYPDSYPVLRVYIYDNSNPTVSIYDSMNPTKADLGNVNVNQIKNFIMSISVFDNENGSVNYHSLNIKSIILSDTVNFTINLTGFKYNNLFDDDQQVPISFYPKSIGTFIATITIKSDLYGDLIVNLSGNGI